VGKFLAEAIAEAAGEGYVECAEALGMMREELGGYGFGAAAGVGALDRVALVSGNCGPAEIATGADAS